MGKSKSAKSHPTATPSKKPKIPLKPPQNPKKKKFIKPKPKNSDDEDPILFGSSPDSRPKSKSKSKPEPETLPTRIESLLEPCTKPQLITFLLDAAASDADLRSKIRALADSDPSHRRIFVHGFSFDTTKETLVQSFAQFGEIEECKLIVDRATGRAKGYGFVLYKTRSAAAKALKEPQKKIGSRTTYCQLASVGATGKPADGGKRVYVSNVPLDADPNKLRVFFAKFGEIETGPIGFDMVTGKSKGYAIFVYKNAEDARRVVIDPSKDFEGHVLNCKFAIAGPGGEGQKVAAPAPAAALVPAPALAPAVASQPALAAMAAAQNLALLGQNPAYAALVAQNPLLAAAALNPGLLNAAALGGGFGFGGVGGGNSVLGTYGGGGQALTGIGLQGLQGFQGLQALQGVQGKSPSSQGGLGTSGMGRGGRFPS